MKVRAFRDADWPEWLRMSVALFPDEDVGEIEKGMRQMRERPDYAVFLAERDDGSISGFVEVGSRSYADGCETFPVGYIEAWYVDPDVRRGGYGRALFKAAEEWARGQGFTEMGSDALLDNEVSHAAHRRIGYDEVGRVVQFRKIL